MISHTAIQYGTLLIFAPSRFEVYLEIAEQIRIIFLSYTDLVEPFAFKIHKILEVDPTYRSIQSYQGQEPAHTYSRNALDFAMKGFKMCSPA